MSISKSTEEFINFLSGQGGHIKDITVDNNVENQTTLFGKPVEVSQDKIIKQVIFEKDTSSIHIETNRNIYFKQCSFKTSRSLMFRSKGSGDWYFEDCVFECRLNFSNAYANSYNFVNCHFEKGVYYKSCDINSVNINNTSDTEVKTNLIEIDSNIDHFLVRSNSIINHINITGKGVKSFLSESTDYKHFTIDTHMFNRIELKNYGFETKCAFQTFSINTIQPLQGIVLLKGCILEQLFLINLAIADGKLKLSDLIIQNSFFKESEFNRVDLLNVLFKRELTISYCNFSGINASNIQWPKNHEISTHLVLEEESQGKATNLQKIASFQIKREAYRQLKALSIANHNQFDAMAFYRNEMETYYQEVKLSKTEKPGTRFLLRVNRFVGDFGLSWTRPLVLLFGSHLLFYWIYLLASHQSGTEYCSAEAIGNGVGQYFRLLVPFNHPDYMKGWPVSILFVMHVLDGFFVYHFLKATRKFKFV